MLTHKGIELGNHVLCEGDTERDYVYTGLGVLLDVVKHVDKQLLGLARAHVRLYVNPLHISGIALYLGLVHVLVLEHLKQTLGQFVLLFVFVYLGLEDRISKLVSD